MKKGITKWLIGAFALTMAVIQPASPVPETLNTVVTAEAATTAPGKIKLKSIKAVTNNRIQINWEKTSGATHYRIFYKQYGAKRWTVLKTTNADTTSYTHTSSAKYPIKCGQRYTYTVRAYNSTTRKWGSYDAKGLTTRDRTNHGKTEKHPDGFRKDSGSGFLEPGVWRQLLQDLPTDSKYRVEPDRQCALYRPLLYRLEPGEGPEEHLHRAYVQQRHESCRRVQHGRPFRNDPKTGTAVGTPKLTAIRSTAYNKIALSWEKAANATHYRVYYKVPGTAWKLITTVGSNVTSYTHTSTTQYPIRCGQKYTYTVRAYNNNMKKLGGYDAVGLSAYTVPSTVTLKTAVQNTDGTVTVSWEKADGGNSYRVYRKTTSALAWKLIDTVNSSVLSYTDKAPADGEKNTYTVRMYNSATNVAGSYDANGVSVTIPEKEPEVTPTPDPEKPEMSIDEMAQEIIRLTNEERTKNGVAPLQYSEKLTNLALIRAQQNANSQPNEEIPDIGESRCRSLNKYNFTPKDIIDDFMDWPGHRYNILYKKFTHIGVGIYQTNEETFWVLLFSNYNPD